MRRVINQKRYDTATARNCGSWENMYDANDFNWYQETLYQKKTGEFFLYGEGNANSKYAQPIGNNSWSGSEQLIPLTWDAARQWAEKNLSAEQYESVFGEVADDDSKTMISLTLPTHAASRLKQIAARTGKTQSDIIASLIMKDIRYTVFLTGGDDDGKEVGWFDDGLQAIKFAKAYLEKHEDELDPYFGGIAIADNLNDNIIENW